MSDNDTEHDDMALLFKRTRGGHHGRDITVSYGATVCVMCEARTMCLAFDSSEGEYGPVRLCEWCLQRLTPKSIKLTL